VCERMPRAPQNFQGPKVRSCTEPWLRLCLFCTFPSDDNAVNVWGSSP